LHKPVSESGLKEIEIYYQTANWKFLFIWKHFVIC